jgi:hypothetical protein
MIVDLRLNSGGNSQVIEPLIKGLKARQSLMARGHLFALIGRSAFSSGLLAAFKFRHDLHAILIGEPSGEKPNSYGEVKAIALPNSKIDIHCSTKFFRIMTGDPPNFPPDVTVGRTLAEALAGKDPVLDAALRHVRPG